MGQEEGGMRGSGGLYWELGGRGGYYYEYIGGEVVGGGCFFPSETMCDKAGWLSGGRCWHEGIVYKVL